MPLRSRATLAVGLGLAGWVALAGPASGQQPDRDVRRTTGQQAATAAMPAVTPATIGTIDLDKVFREYDKVKVSSDRFKQEALKKQGELGQIASEAKTAADKMSQMKPGTPDYQQWNKKVTELKATIEATREQVQQDLTFRESEALAEIYKDIRLMTAAVARKRGMTYVVKTSDEPVSGSDPNSVMSAMARTVVYSDPAADISKEVVTYLNYNYQKANNPTAAGAPAAATPKAAAPIPPPVGAMPKGN
jgi:Skp family chaperone for outer membrane proteins